MSTNELCCVPITLYLWRHKFESYTIFICHQIVLFLFFPFKLIKHMKMWTCGSYESIGLDLAQQVWFADPRFTALYLECGFVLQHGGDRRPTAAVLRFFWLLWFLKHTPFEWLFLFLKIYPPSLETQTLEDLANEKDLCITFPWTVLKIYKNNFDCHYWTYQSLFLSD